MVVGLTNVVVGEDEIVDRPKNKQIPIQSINISIWPSLRLHARRCMFNVDVGGKIRTLLLLLIMRELPTKN